LEPSVPVTTRADGDVITASSHNANCRDQVISTVTSGTRPAGTEGQVIYETDTDAFQAYNGGWMEYGRTAGATTWTPQIDQGASTNLAKTVTTAFYVRIGNIVFAWGTLALTASGTAGSGVTVSLPVTGVGYAANDSIGVGYISDASAGSNSANCSAWIQAGLATVAFQQDTTTVAGRWGANPNIALASGDSIRFSVTYRVA
jgi:hypothetical protein